MKECGNCDGTGHTECSCTTHHTWLCESDECPECEGTGEIKEEDDEPILTHGAWMDNEPSEIRDGIDPKDEL